MPFPQMALPLAALRVWSVHLFSFYPLMDFFFEKRLEKKYCDVKFLDFLTLVRVLEQGLRFNSAQ